METEEDKKSKTGEWCSYQMGNGSGSPCRQMKKESKTEEDGSYQTSQVGRGDVRRKKSKTEEWFNYQTAQVGYGDGRRKKSWTEKMVAITQLRLALEREEERIAKKELGFNLDWDLSFQKQIFSRNHSLARNHFSRTDWFSLSCSRNIKVWKGIQKKVKVPT